MGFQTAVLALIVAATLVTSFISGILGMAGGMVLMGVLLACLTVPQAMALHGITQAASNGWRAAMLFPHIDWRIVRGFGYGALLAAGVFTGARIVLDKPTAFVVLGLMPFATLFLPSRLVLDVQKRGQSTACGMVCMSFSFTAGLAGPILDVFFVRSAMSRHTVVATKAFTQSLSHIVKATYFGTFLSTADGVTFPLAATMVTTAFVGTQLSKPVLARLTDEAFRNWTRWTVLGCGAVYLVCGAIGYLHA
jgi:uncharacterized membrane protein YfcA